MTEHLPQPDRLTDDELIDQHLDRVEAEEIPLSDAAVRMIASQIHEGQSSAMYSFVSTGIVTDRMKDELQRDIEAAQTAADQGQLRRLTHLARYVEQCEHEDTENLPGDQWSKAWLDQPVSGSEDCLVCHAFIADPHGVGCPLGTEDEEMLDAVYALQDEHGEAILHLLNNRGFRSLDELAAVAGTFEDEYHGKYDSLLDYARYISSELDGHPDPAALAEEMEQRLLVVEGFNGGVYIYDR